MKTGDLILAKKKGQTLWREVIFLAEFEGRFICVSNLRNLEFHERDNFTAIFYDEVKVIGTNNLP